MQNAAERCEIIWKPPSTYFRSDMTGTS